MYRSQKQTHLVTALRLVVFSKPDPLIFWVSLCGVIWGAWLLMPWESFATSPTFYVIREFFLNEKQWGLLFIFINGWKLIELYRYSLTGVITRRQIVLNLASFALWVMVAVQLTSANWQSPATPVYGFFALTALWCTAQRGAEYRLQNRSK